jgi:ubiquinone/menaquinone biosynthesis C-methylase UbiE
MPSDRYTHGHHESVLRSHRWRNAENSAGYLLPWLEPGDHLLDVGCGPGTITADLAERVAPGKVVAIDNAPAALETCRTMLADRAVTNVLVRQEDIYELPFEDASFDVVHAHQVLQHLSDPVRALEELRRVCRPGGVVAARDTDYPAMSWYPDDPDLDLWLSVYLAVARGNGAEPAAGRRLLAWAHATGFTTVIPSASVWCYATPEQRQWWGDLWAERVAASVFADHARSGGHAGNDDLQAMAAAWRRWAAEDDGWYIAPHGEVICRP